MVIVAETLYNYQVCAIWKKLHHRQWSQFQVPLLPNCEQSFCKVARNSLTQTKISILRFPFYWKASAGPFSKPRICISGRIFGEGST